MINPSFWPRKRVLVTGSTGFLGGWLIRRLLDYGAKVTAVVRGAKPESQFYSEGLYKRACVELGSVYDAHFMGQVLGQRGFDVLFHAGYGADVTRVLSEPIECFRSTAESTLHILEHLRRNNPGCISVISSSDKAYGSQELPYRESQLLNPRHPYEIAKASQDLLAQSYGRIYGMPVAVTRCANYYGGFDLNFTRLIPGVLKSILRGEAPVLRSDGRFTRDFLYIEDAVDVQLLLAQRLAEDPSLRGEAFNFSYGEHLEVLEIIRRLTSLTGSRIEPIVNNSTQTEIRHMHLSSEKAVERLEWRPRVGFDEGLRRTVDWYAEYFGHRRQYSAAGHTFIAVMMSALSEIPLEVLLAAAA
jgi:CDP-glucose 4,6-dehydratase